ncbi:MAG: acyltransferase [Actinobacteria bacterium]|nr:acyltransferase [Actinomycetota bacterium]
MTLTGTRPTGVESLRHRPALDGVRAVAVGGVVTYHVGALWLPGGFLGVDLFFVLSGFLITGILIDQIDRDGRIAFATFFARRARRLLPALYLLLIVVCAWAAFIAAPQVIGDLRGAALAALFYVANWFFIITGQSYFADMLGPSPLEHTWSLAIEEQYYLLWPLLLLLLARRVSPRILGVIVIVMIVLSVLLMAVLYDEGDPSVAYFGTFARIHELLVGSLLALAVKRGLALPRALRWTAWIPLALIVAMMATVSDTGAFYYRGGSLVFSLVVAWLLLALGSGPPGGGPTALFSWAPIAWIGLISYGIYLWHWPLILWITPASTGLTGPSLAALRLGATLAIATASFYILERPIRRGRIGSFALTPRRLAVIVPVAMAALATVIIASTSRAVAPTADLDVTSAPSELTGATSADARVVAIAGDSIPKELMGSLTDEAARRDWAVLPLSFGGCSVTGTFQVDDEGKAFNWSRRCSDGFADLQEDAITSYDPEVVVWYSNRERFSVRIGGQTIVSGSPEHRSRLDADLEAAYRRLTQHGAQLVIVAPVPKAPPVVGSCAAGALSDEDCNLDDEYYASFAQLTDAYAALAARHPDRVRLVRLDDLLCPGNRDCPLLEQQGEAVRPDGIHFSPEGAAWFIPLLFDRIGIEAP